MARLLAMIDDRPMDDLPQDRSGLIERMGAYLHPPLFIAGVAIGFLCSILAGHLTAGHNMFKNFVRIHQLISPETFFDVSALEIYRLLEEVPAEKILVIVGGTSRFNGAGQRPQELWSRHLQERLGADYAVINLALRAGAADQGGAHAAEALIKAGRRVLYVADWGANRVGPAGAQPRYWYFFYDSLARDLLLDSAARDRAVVELEQGPGQGAVARELRLRSRLNRWFYFDDLWTYIGYRHVFFAAWHSLLRPDPFAARSTLRDPEERLPPDCCYRLRDFDESMRSARTFSSVQFSEDSRERAAKWTKITPQQLRNRSLIVWLALSPFYTDHFPDGERERYIANMIAVAESLRQAGFHAIEIGRDWTASDFVDLFHLSEQGGRKLADIIAPVVWQMARERGYVQ
jgi:hypothetical protein